MYDTVFQVIYRKNMCNQRLVIKGQCHLVGCVLRVPMGRKKDEKYGMTGIMSSNYF